MVLVALSNFVQLLIYVMIMGTKIGFVLWLSAQERSQYQIAMAKWQFCGLADRTAHTNKILPILFHRTQVWVLGEIIVEKCGD